MHGSQSISPTLKLIPQKDPQNFWFDKSLKVVMGPPCLINYTKQIFSWAHRSHTDNEIRSDQSYMQNTWESRRTHEKTTVMLFHKNLQYNLSFVID